MGLEAGEFERGQQEERRGDLQSRGDWSRRWLVPLVLLLVYLSLTRETMGSAKPHGEEEPSDVFCCRAIYTRRQQVVYLENSGGS